MNEQRNGLRDDQWRSVGEDEGFGSGPRRDGGRDGKRQLFSPTVCWIRSRALPRRNRGLRVQGGPQSVNLSTLPALRRPHGDEPRDGTQYRELSKG